jgi:hypothetical protein
VRLLWDVTDENLTYDEDEERASPLRKGGGEGRTEGRGRERGRGDHRQCGYCGNFGFEALAIGGRKFYEPTKTRIAISQQN